MNSIQHDRDDGLCIKHENMRLRSPTKRNASHVLPFTSNKTTKEMLQNPNESSVSLSTIVGLLKMAGFIYLMIVVEILISSKGINSVSLLPTTVYLNFNDGRASSLIRRRNQKQSNQFDDSIDEYDKRNHVDYKNVGHYDTDLNRRVYDDEAMDKIDDMKRPPILIVGGLDGSGTRVFAEMLLNVFGVQMLYDDNISYDLHGITLCSGLGWPGLANLILNTTKSANYEPSIDLAPGVYEAAISELKSLRSSTEIIASFLRADHINKWKQSMSMNSTEPAYALGTLYGFKAPISMVLLPLLREVYGNVKFIHVVRDGRDVALSSNKSPVEKYYNTYKGLQNAQMMRDMAENVLTSSSGDTEHPSETTTLRSLDSTSFLEMDLWNDWNVQVYEYAKKHWNDDNFDYITVRAEDMLPNTDTIVRLQTLRKIGHFVGTQRTEQDISQFSASYAIQDMGKSIEVHDNNVEKNPSTPSENMKTNDDVTSTTTLPPTLDTTEDMVTSRYGKWKRKLKNYPQILHKLNEIGSNGLRLFRYERIVDRDDTNSVQQQYKNM